MKFEFVGGVADGKTMELPYQMAVVRWPVDQQDLSSINCRRMGLSDHEEYVFLPTTGKYHLPQSAAYKLYQEECNRVTTEHIRQQQN